MRSLFRQINIPTLVAVIVFVAIDRAFDLSGKLLGLIGKSAP